MSTNAQTSDLDSHLSRLGLNAFRPGQREVVASLLDGEDCLCIMPTGGGKSLCYQLPAIIRDGLAVVVSPLIALMKDQVDDLRQRGIRADLINSSLTPSEQQMRLKGIQDGIFDLIYVAPERFRSQRFIELLQETTVSLLAVDEAHCISEWGHDFRHDYARLGRYRRRIGSPQTIALTATATPDVQADIVKQLDLEEPKIFIAGFSRPSLSLQVQQTSNRREKERILHGFLQSHAGCGIIYASTRKACDELAASLNIRDRRQVGVYHAGLTQDDRRAVQESFMSDELDIVVATNAFGMGIDKADIRFVVHFNMPGSVEAYYQEAGRAGRDGQPATCLMLATGQDRHIQEFFIESAYPERSVVAQVYEYLRTHPDDPVEITQEQLRETLDLSISNEGVGTCERLLEKSGILERLEPHRNMAVVHIDSELPTLVDLLPKQAKAQRKVLRIVESVVGDQRFEPIYVQPQQWTNGTDLSLPAITKALRELTKLDAFQYVPPFRGRAVHMIQHDRPFDQLDIDFETLNARKQADYDKLDYVQQLGRTLRCRQLEILEYFGESAGEPCGNCDNCLRNSGHSPSTASDGATDIDALGTERVELAADPAVCEATRIVLSGVARAQERFGKNIISGMLCGSRSAKITKWRLDQLSTFGLLRHLTQVEVGKLIDTLARASLLQQNEVDRFRPILKLTELGREVMKGQKLPSQPLRVPAMIRTKLNSYHRPTPEKLAPEKLAPSPAKGREEQPVAPAKPTATPDESKRIARVDSPEVPANDGAVHPNYYWTWRLMVEGYSLEECSAVRGVEANLLVDHLIQAAEQGWKIEPDWLLTHELISELEDQMRAVPDIGLRALSDKFKGRLPQARILFYLKCRTSAK